MGGMEIAYLGHSSFKIKGKSSTVITDPYDASIGLKFPKSEADIVTVSHQHPDHNQVDQVGNVKKVIAGPGEYEIGGVSIIGITSFHDNQSGAERGKNTMYVIEMDGLRLAHLGDLGHTLSEKQLEEIGEIDVLFIPVGGVYTITSVEATEVARQIEPNYIIPMHYQAPGLSGEMFAGLEPVDAFVKQIALTAETLPKLSIKETLEEETKLVILEHK